MNRRELLAGAAAVTALPAHAAATSEDSKLRALLDAFWEETLDASPATATLLGLDTGKRAAQRGQLGDASRAGRIAWVERQQQRLRRLRSIDRAKLSEAAKIDHDVVLYQARTASEGGARWGFGEGSDGFGYAPYSPHVLSQLSGPYQAIPDFLDSNHPVATASDAEAWLSRMVAYAVSLDASTEAAELDAKSGVLAPDFALDLTLEQLRAQRAASGLPRNLARKASAAGVAGDWQNRAAAIVQNQINPALDRQIEAVTRLRKAAKPDAGVWKLANGSAYYAGALAFHTTTTLSPEEVHTLGLRQVADLSGQLDPLLKAQGLTTGTVGARLTALGRRPENLWPNDDAGRAALLKSLNVQMEDIRTRLPRAFATLPKAPVEIVRVPPDIEAGAPGGYALPASADGLRPGRYYINLKDTADWPKFNLPTLTYHEAYPGHQWQGAISDGSADIPALRRYAGGYAAYGEGWALYAEDLAAELGVYDGDPLGRIGYLQSLLFRATRMVVDTGLHHKRWSREKATAYMIDATGFAPGRAAREINRYCIWPGQACSYKVGHNEWVRLRKAVAAKQGAKFDLKAFHEVLRLGDMPLTVLAQVVMARA
ncbi:DUF885 domain-containing protein [Glacieibacterium frigidum]|uniref:DUF885 family protein n=1 Tax=Glacieibacterium frigidum TaxID=2593303 RepID=A0A552UI13_9SPHN|nr:DUF885 family protein [Glacieibacterium frigidum]TRW17830.1 DUF885 family protein [Glacieibacterium frigidum]